MNVEADPVLVLCEKRIKAWTLANDSPGSDAIDFCSGVARRLQIDQLPYVLVANGLHLIEHGVVHNRSVLGPEHLVKNCHYE